MIDNNKLLAGLTSSVFDDNDAKFNREQSFGKKLLITAWSVEILAATIGLIIAFTMAYDAYSNSEVKNVNTTINALLGALPFLLIAIIEPTKIPLATGLYKVKKWGWKLLILLALVGLTAVTFETLFTGLERQVTNVTAKINRGKNSIQVLEKENLQLVSDIEQLRSIDLSAETKDLDAQIQKNRSLEEQQINTAKQDYEAKLNTLNGKIETAFGQLANIDANRNTKYQKTVAAIQSTLDAYNDQINGLKQSREQSRQNLQKLSENNFQDKLVENYQNRILAIEATINEVESWLSSKESEQIKKLQRKVGVVDDGKTGANTLRNFDLWKASEGQKIASLQKSNQVRLSELSNVSQDEKNIANEKLSQQSIEIRALEAKRTIKEQELQSARMGDGKVSAPNNIEIIEKNKITQIRQEIDQLDSRHNEDLNSIRSSRAALQQNYELEKQQIETKSLKARNTIPEKEGILEINTNKILDLEQHLVEDAQHNQIYRFAQKWFEYENILEVKEKDLTWVAIIWFGSIALVCATVGTILALISSIMMDPDAFVDKQQKRQNNKLARSIRKLSLAFRKRLTLKVRTIKVEVPVEVEKIVEVDKIIEKVIEKVIIQEVDKLVPEIVPIPIFVPNGGDANEEVQKVAGNYAELNQKVRDSFHETARRREDYEPK